ncbi:MAG: 23S rRNA (adenine(2503)-C(2))-methyltransferase RlmN [Polyangiaceae bacterium]|nr:23S rRNA (adenine(2503)-C(2))-methyltransferase RlmN [Polyangiaceae bacterium]
MLQADAFAQSPLELKALGLSSSSFAALQRPWLWSEEGPILSGHARSILRKIGLERPQLLHGDASRDGATKLLLDLQGERIEAVHMPRNVGTGRVTLCISSQVGCGMGCRFCATASMGFRRHLSAGEIVVQVLAAVHRLGPRHPGDLTLVFMGMGEPLHNFSAVAKAISILTDPLGMGMAPRRITVSTSGLVPEIGQLGRLPVRPLLAVSLNATTDSLRSDLMPIGRRYHLADLAAALKAFPLRPKERITLEYVLLSGVNDSPEDAVRLAEFARPLRHHINLIPFNEHEHAEFRSPTEERVDNFFRELRAAGAPLVTVRHSRGRDVQGACGQLVQAHAPLLRLSKRLTSAEA